MHNDCFLNLHNKKIMIFLQIQVDFAHALQNPKIKLIISRLFEVNMASKVSYDFILIEISY